MYVAQGPGSHHVVTRDDVDTVVPVHANRPLAIGTLRKILRDIDLSPDDFVERFNK
ncbi:MAG: type II toxin-antitoxin system HicA family toxin [Pirellulales bacterium]